MRHRLAAASIAALVVLAAAAPAAGAWRWPVDGDVVTHFSATEAAPFAAGRHRGIGIAAGAGAGARVRSACSGRVAFAAAVGRAGVTVSIRCGALRSTYQGLAAASVRRGQHVSAGALIGVLDRAGVLRLGARRERQGTAIASYVDPLTLLHRQPPTLGPAPACRVCPGHRTRGRRQRPRHRQPVATAPGLVAEPAPSPLPRAAWLGLALLALAAPPGAVVRRRRRARPAGALASRRDGAHAAGGGGSGTI